MRIAFGSDESTPLTQAIERWLREAGHEPVFAGALRPGEDDAWPAVGRSVAELVASNDCTNGIVCCWSGTGVSIAANKVAGIRAALCTDVETARAARTWNDANVLALSLRLVSEAVALELLSAWFETRPTTDPRYREMITNLESSETKTIPAI